MFTKEALLTANIETLQNNLIHESTRNDFRSKLTLGLCEIQGIGITQNIPAGSQKIFDVLFAGKEYSHNILRLLKNLDQDILKKLFDYYHVKKIESIQDRLVLACLYMNAIGVQNNEKEIERAFDLLTLAANNNNAPAQNMLGELLQKTRDVSEKINGKCAFDWFKMAADQNYAPAQNNLANCLWRETSITKNESLAFELFGLAADEGYARAQTNLGTFYREKISTPNNNTEQENNQTAVKLFTLAAKQEYSGGQNELGVCYLRGIGVEKNDENELYAIKCFMLAAAQEHKAALFNIGYCYRHIKNMDTKFPGYDKKSAAIEIFERLADPDTHVTKLIAFPKDDLELEPLALPIETLPVALPIDILLVETTNDKKKSKTTKKSGGTFPRYPKKVAAPKNLELEPPALPIEPLTVEKTNDKEKSKRIKTTVPSITITPNSLAQEPKNTNPLMMLHAAILDEEDESKESEKAVPSSNENSPESNPHLRPPISLTQEPKNLSFMMMLNAAINLDKEDESKESEKAVPSSNENSPKSNPHLRRPK